MAAVVFENKITGRYNIFCEKFSVTLYVSVLCNIFSSNKLTTYSIRTDLPCDFKSAMKLSKFSFDEL